MKIIELKIETSRLQFQSVIVRRHAQKLHCEELRSILYEIDCLILIKILRNKTKDIWGHLTSD